MANKMKKIEALKKRTKSYRNSLIEFSSIVRKTDELQIELKQLIRYLTNPHP